MFKEIFGAFRKRDSIADMYAMFDEMLTDAQWMFQRACEVVDRAIPALDIRQPLYQRDKRVNELERSIRSRLVVHLVTGHEHDAGICLVLMSVVKDAERIGDYCKNLFEVGQSFQGIYRREEYLTPLREAAARLDELFPAVRRAFRDSDPALAADAVENCATARHRCEELVRLLLTPGGQSAPDEAVALAMRARFLKRIAAHLGNIATSVTNPLPMLDYHAHKPFDEPADSR